MKKPQRRRTLRPSKKGTGSRLASEIFRSTFLDHLDLAEARAVVDFGEVLFRAVLEAAAPIVPAGYSTTRGELHAVAVDLRMGETLLERIGEERTTNDLDAHDAALSRRAERIARKVGRIAAELEQVLADSEEPAPPRRPARARR